MLLTLVDLASGFDPKKVITNPSTIELRSRSFTDDGLFSPYIFGDIDGRADIYSCKCGNYTGKFLRGEICNVCNTPIKERSSSLSKFGWIDLKEYKIFNPYFFNLLKEHFGKETIEEIIRFDPKMDLNGKILPPKENESHFKNIGMKTFQDNFFEVLEALCLKKKKDKALYRFFASNKHLLFIDKIPVAPIALRPGIVINDHFKHADENKFYNNILVCLKDLEEQADIEKIDQLILQKLRDIQLNANQLYEKFFSNLIGKEGYLRLLLLGNRVNFSARTIIGPLANNSGYSLDDVHYPYMAALELYKFEIINILRGLEGSYIGAIEEWHKATTKFSPKVYSIMQKLVTKTKGGLNILVNRAPTINLGSILYMRIAKIKPDYWDFSLGLPNNIVSWLAADYDGDVITTISLKDAGFRKSFKQLRPSNLVIGKDTGLFSPSASLSKDYKLGFTSFIN